MCSWGSGDFNLTQSTVSNNYVDGVNITYGGGNRNVSWSKIENNVGYGMAVWLNETTGGTFAIITSQTVCKLLFLVFAVNFPVRQETVVAYTNVTLNYDIGVLVGNFCGPAVVNISGNYFTYGRYIGLEVGAFIFVYINSVHLITKKFE